jgi:thiamine biosynthesis lipoprotein
VRLLTHSWSAIATTNAITATLPHAIVPASQLAQRAIADLDAAASGFQADSELSILNVAARTRTITTIVSPMLGECIAAALHAARITDGLVDPTLHDAVVAAGDDTNNAQVRARPDTLATETPVPHADWRKIVYDSERRRLTLPRGMALDIGATGKAAAADAIARRLARALPGGFLVNIGGDIAVSGAVPVVGWPVAVEDRHGEVLEVVAGYQHAFATSSTRKRSWTGGELRSGHVIDPRTRRPSEVVWTQVTCVAASAVEASAAGSGAIILGEDAPRWLTQLGLPARLDRLTGEVVHTPHWQNTERVAA